MKHKHVILIASFSIIGIGSVLFFGKKSMNSSGRPGVTSNGMEVASSGQPSAGGTEAEKLQAEGAIGSSSGIIKEGASGQNIQGQVVAHEAGQEVGAQSDAPKAPKAPKCYVATFKAQKIDKKAPEKKNRLELSETAFSSKDTCVRVDGKPVQFVKATDKSKELWIAGLESNEAKITVAYCDAGLKLQQDCTVPKDEFLSAMAGESGEDAEVAGQWAGKKAITAEEQSAEREIASFADALTGDAARNFFTRWKVDTQVEEGGQTASR